VPPSPLLSGGRYRLLEVLGSGGMATVYSAWDEVLHVHRAVKLLRPNLVNNESLRTRFLSEARTMAALAHPNVVTVHDFGQEDQRIYIVMEWMGGGSLAGLLEQHGPLHPGRVLSYLLPVVDALGAAHEQGIVHRDVKPDNVLLTERGVPKISDFGIAHVTTQNRSLTRTGMAMGTWAYMAPEQRADAKHADHRADIYAVGATLFNLVTGREPLDLYASNLHTQLFRGVSSDLAELIQAATRYEPEERYANTQVLADAMGELVQAFTDPGPLQLEVIRPPPPPAATDGLAAAVAGGVQVAAVEPKPPPPAASQTFSGSLWGDEPDPPGGEPTPDLDAPEPAQGTFTLAPEDNPDAVAAPKAQDTFAPEIHEPAPSQPTAVPPEDPPKRARRWPLALAAVVLMAGIGGYGLLQALAPDGAPGDGVVAVESEPPLADAAPEPAHREAVVEPAEPPPMEPEPAPVEAAAPAPPAPAQERPPEPAPVAVAPAPAPAPVMGELFINTLPPGQVSIDGAAQRSIPVLGEAVRVGSHELLLVGPEGQRATQRIRVVDGSPTRFCWDFNKGAECARR
jgi:serine/threonine protein kinase